MSSWRDLYAHARVTRGVSTGPRGGYHGSGTAVRSPTTEPSLDLPLGDILATINISETTPSHLTPKIENCEYVASYNWLDCSAPTILVPGSPPVWTPPVSRQRLPEDSGEYFRDPNAARYPKHPTEPAIRALFAMQPKLNTATIDIVACGSTLGNLLRFASSQERSFRFDVDIIGGTMFFIRRERSPKELIEGIRGYGHTFPESHTTWAADVKGSASHQRIIKYSFGGLRIIVRSEADGYLNDRTQPRKSSVSKLSENHSDVDEDLALSMSLNVSERVANTDETLLIKPGGQKVPQKAIFDIKTRSAKKEIDMDDVLPRLWMNQTPSFIIAYHKFGDFSEPQIQDVRPEILAWEAGNAKLLGHLRAVIQNIKDQANALGLRSFEIVRTGTGPLQLRKQVGDQRRAVSSDLRADWELRGNNMETSKEGKGNVASVGSNRFGDSLEDFSDEESEKDFTACSLDDCGYCGHCTY
ncbi:MAG: hypothetical protein M1812_007357 [Candelaria pacifica]|nr:MAG: hypothetical protein M1812_007357 [Candelaria pacifica]